MILSDFSETPIEEQVKEINREGKFVTYFIIGVYAVTLFQLHDYYVELYYHIPKLRVEQINCFDCTDKKLLPYLKKGKLDL